jgi:hypothetical protein
VIRPGRQPDQPLRLLERLRANPPARRDGLDTSLPEECHPEAKEWANQPSAAAGWPATGVPIGTDSGIPRAANFERPGGRNAKRRKILGLMAVTKPKPPMEKGISSEEKLSEDPE